MNILPHEILPNIYVNLNFIDLQNFGRVTKTLNKVTNDSELLKNTFYRDQTFNSEDWAFYFGENYVDEARLAYSLIPEYIMDIIRSPCPIFSDKKLGETHFFVWIPGNLNLLEYYRIVDLLDPKICLDMQGKYFVEVMMKISEAGWVLIPKKVMPESVDKQFKDQVKMVDKLENYKVPKALEAIVCMISSFLKFNIKVFDCYNGGSHYYTLCQESVQFGRIAVGSCLNCFSVTSHPDAFPHQRIGMAPILKLKDIHVK